MSATTNLLHRLWPKAVGTSDYCKSEWRQLQHDIEKLERIAERNRQPEPKETP